MYTRCIMFLVVLAFISAELPLSSCFQWIRPNGNVETKLTLPTRTSKKPFELKWEWNLGNGETTNQAEIKRYKTNNKDATATVIVVLFSDNKASISNEFKSFYTINAQVGTASGNNGFMNLTITDISNQGNNKDNTPVNLMVANYTYECGLTIRDVSNQPVSQSRTNTLIVLVIPFITTAPQGRLVTNRRTDITLTCIADGKPPPTISWERISQFAGISDFKGKDLVISKSTGDDDFQNSDIGTYICTAANEVGSVSATALLQYTECNAGCSVDDKIVIEMTNLTYVNDYGNEVSFKYKELKAAIEKECFAVYSKAPAQNVYSCFVTRFSSGEVYVMAAIKITYPNGTNEPRKPLETAIKTGMFAGHEVRSSFVVPVKPIIRTAPQDRLVTNRRTNITLKCIADGKPRPIITWTGKSVFGGQSVFSGEDLIISNSTGDDDFQNSDIGTYICTATNEVGSVSATALLQYTECKTGCSIDDKIAIEMTNLTYVNDYGNKTSFKYKELKAAIEKECFVVYTKVLQAIYSCIVTGFSSIGVYVIAVMKITYPSDVHEPRKPLETAIKTGMFAGHEVRPTFVVHVKPIIRTAPQDRLVANRRTDITLKCTADGIPRPTITWNRKSMFSGHSVIPGEHLVISKSTGDDDFQNSDIGTYICTATNEVGNVSATALLQYTECNTGCSTDDKIAIEMTDLTYVNDYGNKTSFKYKELKAAIEKECFVVYTKVLQAIYSCIVTGFSSIGVYVIAAVKITYPSDVHEPRKPLETAIKTGMFAGHEVRPTFVVHVKPIIRMAPQDRLVSNRRTDITLKCIAEGYPKSNITWKRRSVFAGQSVFNGGDLVISKSTGDDDFKNEDIGVYSCIATNALGSASAEALIQYIECNTGCSTDDKIAIGMIDLSYDIDYGNQNSAKFKVLKHAIEKECFAVYARAIQKVYSCIVTRLSNTKEPRGFIAIIKITYPSDTNEPRKPLETAVKTGTFAGYNVKDSLVSPLTSPAATVRLSIVPGKSSTLMMLFHAVTSVIMMYLMYAM